MSILAQWWEWLPKLLDGLKMSLSVTGLSLLLGLPLGLVLAMLMISQARPVRLLALVVVELGRGFPLLVLLYVVYWGFSDVGFALSTFAAAVVAISFSTGAYTSEIFRAGLLSVPRGHIEAAQSLGLHGRDEQRFVVLPQAVRAVVPPLMSYSVIIFQATSLGFAISLPELLSRGYQIGSATFQFLSVFALVGLMYAVVSIVVSRLVDRVHQRVGV